MCNVSGAHGFKISCCYVLPISLLILKLLELPNAGIDLVKESPISEPSFQRTIGRGGCEKEAQTLRSREKSYLFQQSTLK